MSKTVKIVLIVLGSLLLLMGTCVGGGVWWLSSKAEEIKAGAEEMESEARGFAQVTDSRGCLDEAVRRNIAKTGLMDEVKIGVFLTTCLQHAAPAEGFCDGVPPESEIMASVKWRLAACQESADPDPQRCSRLMAPVQRHCQARR